MPVSRGTDEWLIVEMNSRGIPKLLTDLNNLEQCGFDDKQCAVIRSAINTIINEANTLAQTSLLREFVTTYEDFLQTYTEWNGAGTDTTNDAIARRRRNLVELRESNRKVNRAIRKKRKSNRLSVTNDDAKVAKVAYKEFRKIVDSNPNIFPSLTSSVKVVESQGWSP